MEHAVPEQMFTDAQHPGEGISAVKALQKANQQGQRIYHITPANQASTLPHIHHSALVMDEIRNALNAGKEVITHTDAVSVPGWGGAGYILYDPQIGDGAFKIGGGSNGSFFAGLLFANAVFLIIALAITLPGMGILLGIYLSVFVGLLASLSVMLGIVHLLRVTASGQDTDIPCLLSGMITSLNFALLAVAQRIGLAGVVAQLFLPSTFPNPMGCLGD